MRTRICRRYSRRGLALCAEAGVHAWTAQRIAGRPHLCRDRSPVRPIRRLPARGRRVQAGDRIAIQMPNCLAVPDRGLRHAQGGPGDGQHQSALHAAGDGPPVHRQRRGRTDHHRPLRDEGARGASEDVDQDAWSWSHLRPAAAAQAMARVRAVQKYVREDDSARSTSRT